MKNFTPVIKEIITDFEVFTSIKYEVEIEPNKIISINRDDLKSCMTYLEVVQYLQKKYKTNKNLFSCEECNILVEYL